MMMRGGFHGDEDEEEWGLHEEEEEEEGGYDGFDGGRRGLELHTFRQLTE